MDLESKLDRAVGTKQLTAKLDLHTVGDLIRHYPRRYLDRGSLTDLSELREGEQVTVMARVVSAKNYSYGNRRTRTEVVITDGTGRLLLTFFNQRWVLKRVHEGVHGLFAGKVDSFRGRLQLLHPEMELLDDDATASRLTRSLIPIYPAANKLPSWKIANAVEHVLDDLGELPDPIPADVRERHSFVEFRAALEGVHRPDERPQLEQAKRRLRYEEAFVTQTVLARRRYATAHESAVSRPQADDGLRARFEKRLPFELTTGQRELVAQLGDELAGTIPMHRLLQGEVGSGKTIVALLAMLQVVDSGGQAVMLAPTEVLAQQHQRSITAMLGPLAAGGMLGGEPDATRVRLLTGSMGAKARKESLLDAASGEAGIVIGTHALLEDPVQFADLGLVVIDEQHRFGVEQRATLAEKAAAKPHVLVMTATPIPRTVAMTSFGDLETSTLRELPAGRQPIQTNVVPARDKPEWLVRAWQRVREEVERGRQAYVVCSRIGDTDGGVADEPTAEPEFDADADESQERPPPVSVLALYDELSSGPLSGLRVAVLHGRMPADEKDTTMQRFSEGDIDVVVSTTVIEVGVDVPNASVMVVMDADRFGVSQLHQLRGRVGRGDAPGLCLLVTAADPDGPSRERLDAVASTTDGFELARLDVELRREGDVLGFRQSGGRSGFRFLSVVRHEDVIEQARADAWETVSDDPDLAGEPGLLAAVLELERTERADYLERS
ncbi:ATP-dependent DNA helicase RecG [Solicola gregarius]|uniref:ATP-dependent DNA helicase RecG n=1 Tax=Solicola gregarius TaxID=2908642 RepID=A0AA46YLN8_9ACTN|nr:ATP-dependent DNA helicase RecG [Solicola gregarius]UYM05696.1 ATP-dependent DNA helicase RecG [Solicola gregarius]